MRSNLEKLFIVQESIKHFPILLRKSLKVIAKGDFLELWGPVVVWAGVV